MTNEALSTAASAIMAHLNLIDEQKAKRRVTEAQRKKQIAQAKDIPNEHMIRLVKALAISPSVHQTRPLKFHYKPGRWVMIWEICRVWNEIPELVIKAKLRKLISQGYLDGCWCGCRGDFELTPKGEEFLADIDRRCKTN